MLCQMEISTIPMMEGSWENPRMAKPSIDAAAAKAIFLDRLSQLMTQHGLSMHRLSVEIGANPGYVRDLFDADKNTRPSGEMLARMAERLQSSTDYLIGRAELPDPVRSEVGLVQDRRLAYQAETSEAGPPIPLVGTGDCASLEVLDESGKKRVKVERSTFDPDYTVRYIRRPPALMGARDVYAVEFHGESMVRRFEPGDIGLVDPGRPVRVGDYVLVQLRERDGSKAVGSVLAKRLVRQNAHEYVLEQFNPELVFIVPREEVVRIHRIMRPNDLLF